MIILTTKTKYRLGGLSAWPRNQDISSEKKKCPFFVPKIQYRQEKNNAGENHAERAWYARTDSCCSETEAPQPYSASLSMCQLRGDEYGSSVFGGFLHGRILPHLKGMIREWMQLRERNLNNYFLLRFRLFGWRGLFARFLLHGFFRHCVPPVGI